MAVQYFKAKDIFISRRTADGHFEEYPLIARPDSFAMFDTYNNIVALPTESVIRNLLAGVTGSYWVKVNQNDPTGSTLINKLVAGPNIFINLNTSSSNGYVLEISTSVIQSGSYWNITASMSTSGSYSITASYAYSSSYASTASYLNEGANIYLSQSYIYANTSSVSPSFKTGQFWWDKDNITYTIDTDTSRLQIGQENYVRAIAGETIPDGAAVYIIGSNNGIPIVKLGIADGTNTKHRIIGLSTQHLQISQSGFITTHGNVNGLDTSTFNDGDSIYLSDVTSGSYITTHPVHPGEIVGLGKVLYANSGSGKILVNISFNDRFFTYTGMASIPTLSTTGSTSGSIINIGTSSVHLCQSPDGKESIANYLVPSASFVVTSSFLDVQFLVVTYNSGSPIYDIKTDLNSINDIQTVPVATFTVGAGNSFSYIDWDESAILLANKLDHKNIDLYGAQRSSGLNLSVSSSHILITSGAGWIGAKSYTLNSASSANANQFVLIGHSASIWSGSFANGWINNRYDDGTNLQTLGNNRYVVNYIWRGIGSLNRCQILLSNQYNQYGDAVESVMPSPPDELKDISILCGRIITQQGNSTPLLVESAFTTIFSVAGITNHNLLNNLQGGTTNEYYHLTVDEYAGTGNGIFVRQSGSVITGSISNAVTASYITASNIQGFVAFANSASSAAVSYIATTASSAASASFATWAFSASSAPVAYLATTSSNSTTAYSATTASFALSSSFITASNISGIVSLAISASSAASAYVATTASNAASASAAMYAYTSSFASSASNAALSVYSTLANSASNSATAYSSTTSSYSLTASYIIGQSATASYALTASVALTSLAGGTTLNTGSIYPITASWANNVTSASYSLTASYISGSVFGVIESASYAATASYALNSSAGGTSLTTGSTYPITASWANNSVSASYSLTSSYITGSVSFDPNTTYQLTASNAISSSYALTSSNAIGYATQQALDDLASSIGVGGTYLVSGGSIIWIGGYSYTVSSATYYILGSRYTSSYTSLTLSGSDPADDRIDVIAVDNSSSVIVIQGTASASPTKPDVDPNSQLELTFIYVQAGSTSPTSSADVTIYRENASYPTEWSASSNSANIDTNSTSGPRSGSKCIEATSAVAGNYVQFTTSSFLANSNASVYFYIKSKAAWATNKYMRLGWFSGSTQRGTYVNLDDGVLGFNSADTTNWQPIIVPLTYFSIPTSSSINILRMEVQGGGGNIGWRIDDVYYQVGSPPVAPVGLTRAEADALYLKIDQNLADVLNVSASRVNLGLGTSATRNVGSSSLDVAPGDVTPLSSSYAITASYAISSSITAQSITASYSATASYVPGVLTASGSNNYFTYWNNNLLSTTSQLYQSGSNIGVGGVTSPTAILHLNGGTATAGTAPIKLTSGNLMSSPEIGAVEFNSDTDLYLGIVDNSAPPSGYQSNYPPDQTGTYVKATNTLVGDLSQYGPQLATDPAKSLTGSGVGNQWWDNSGGGNRFHIDIGTGNAITRVYYENGHVGGGSTNRGVRAFTLWGSNNATAFSTLTYGTHTNWTQLTTSISEFAQHTAADIPDPQYFTVNNSSSYRYYGFEFNSDWGAGWQVVRRIELQSPVYSGSRKGIVLNNGTTLTSGRVPYATTNGRLTDSSAMTFNGTTLSVTSSVAVSASYAPPAFLLTSGSTYPITASWSNNSTSASYALSSSYAPSTPVISSSYALSASYAPSISSSFSTFASTASYISGSIDGLIATSSFSISSSFSTFAATASYISGSIDGLIASSSVSTTSSYATFAVTASYISGSIDGLIASSSVSTTSSYVFIYNPPIKRVTASYTVTPSDQTIICVPSEIMYITLPSNPAGTPLYTIKNASSSSAFVNVTSSILIDTAYLWTLGAYNTLIAQYDGVVWNLL